MITSELTIAAPPALVHDLLTDVGAWKLWAPHVTRVEPPQGHVAPGWRGSVKAWFSPVATQMHVTWVRPEAGMGWETPGFGHVLRYEQRIATPASGGSHVTFTAEVTGPAGPALTRLASPLSALGQRRRLARLRALAEWQAERSGPPASA